MVSIWVEKEASQRGTCNSELTLSRVCSYQKLFLEKYNFLLFISRETAQGELPRSVLAGVEAWFSIGHEGMHPERLASFHTQTGKGWLHQDQPYFQTSTEITALSPW